MPAKSHSGAWRGCAVAAGLATAGWLASAQAQTADSVAGQNVTVGNVTAANANGNATTGNVTVTTGSTTTDAEYELLMQFIQLPPERIKELLKVLERLDAMSPEDRAALKQRVVQQVALIKSMRSAVGPEIKALSPRDRDILRRYMVSLNPEDTQAWLDRAKAATTPEQRTAVLQDMLTSAAARGITPNLEISDKVTPPGGPGDRPRGGPGGDFGPFGPDGMRGLPPPKGEHGPGGPPPPPPPPAGNTTTPAGNGN